MASLFSPLVRSSIYKGVNVFSSPKKVTKSTLLQVVIVMLQFYSIDDAMATDSSENPSSLMDRREFLRLALLSVGSLAALFDFFGLGFLLGSKIRQQQGQNSGPPAPPPPSAGEPIIKEPTIEEKMTEILNKHTHFNERNTRVLNILETKNNEPLPTAHHAAVLAEIEFYEKVRNYPPTQRAEALKTYAESIFAGLVATAPNKPAVFILETAHQSRPQNQNNLDTGTGNQPPYERDLSLEVCNQIVHMATERGFLTVLTADENGYPAKPTKGNVITLSDAERPVLVASESLAEQLDTLGVPTFRIAVHFNGGAKNLPKSQQQGGKIYYPDFGSFADASKILAENLASNLGLFAPRKIPGYKVVAEANTLPEIPFVNFLTSVPSTKP